MKKPNHGVVVVVVLVVDVVVVSSSSRTYLRPYNRDIVLYYIVLYYVILYYTDFPASSHVSTYAVYNGV